MMAEEILLQDRWSKEIGLAQSVVQKLQNFLLNQRKIDLSTAKNAGQRKEAHSADKFNF